jgi:hypothetical protein
MINVLAESPHFFSGKRVLKISTPTPTSLEELTSVLSALVDLGDVAQDDLLIEIHDEEWGEYVHLENMEELQPKARLRLSSFSRGLCYEIFLYVV